MTNTLPDLALALTTNPALHLLVEQGRFDLATPAYALDYNLDHLRLPPGGRERIHVNCHDRPSAKTHERTRTRFP